MTIVAWWAMSSTISRIRYASLKIYGSWTRRGKNTSKRWVIYSPGLPNMMCPWTRRSWSLRSKRWVLKDTWFRWTTLNRIQNSPTQSGSFQRRGTAPTLGHSSGSVSMSVIFLTILQQDWDPELPCWRMATHGSGPLPIWTPLRMLGRRCPVSVDQHSTIRHIPPPCTWMYPVSMASDSFTSRRKAVEDYPGRITVSIRGRNLVRHDRTSVE